MDESYYRSLEPFWGSWHIVGKQIGEGAYGKIFEIEREDFGKKYTAALKVMTVPRSESEWENIRSEGMTEEGTREYFHDIVAEIIDETILMSELCGHSNIVSYEDHMVIEHADRHGWDILIRMELLSPLVPAIKDQIVDRATIIKIGIDICKALEVCQKRRIIHRDIKPDNILFNGDGDFKLGDFGVAKIMEQGKDATTAKQGTVNYMAPEVWRSLPYNSTADIYSLGTILYQLANRNRCILFPLEGTLTYQIKENATNRRMMGESFSYPVDAQDELGQVILKACAYLPADRYQTATEFRMALERVDTQMNDAHEIILADSNMDIDTSVNAQIPSTVKHSPEDEPEQISKGNEKKFAKIKRTLFREKKLIFIVFALIIFLEMFLIVAGRKTSNSLQEENQGLRQQISVLNENKKEQELALSDTQSNLDAAISEMDELKIKIENYENEISDLNASLSSYKNTESETNKMYRELYELQQPSYAFYTNQNVIFLKKGEQRDILLRFPTNDRFTVYYQGDNSYVTGRWNGSWFDNNCSVIFTITAGNLEGSTLFTFTNSINNLSVQVRVYVID